MSEQLSQASSAYSPFTQGYTQQRRDETLEEDEMARLGEADLDRLAVCLTHTLLDRRGGGGQSVTDL